MTSSSHQHHPSHREPRRITKLVYFVRHAEALHNVKEQEAVAHARGYSNGDKVAMERARKSVLQDESLRDAPLSPPGVHQVRQSASRLQHLYQQAQYPCPQLVLVSPLRRTLMTATELFLQNKQNAGNNIDISNNPPRFQALEILREKRTGFAADERRSAAELSAEFPHVNFEEDNQSSSAYLFFSPVSSSENSSSSPSLLSYPTPPLGETNAQVQIRARIFAESLYLSTADAIAVVSHKGWLRELRHVVREWVEEGRVHVDFDLQAWEETLYGNAEIRVVQMTYEQQYEDLAAEDDSSSPTHKNKNRDQQHDDHQEQKKNPSNTLPYYQLVSIVSRGVEGLLHNNNPPGAENSQETTPTTMSEQDCNGGKNSSILASEATTTPSSLYSILTSPSTIPTNGWAMSVASSLSSST